ncbi:MULTISPECIES: hypothetical protein [unclassified Bradyrhizobium]|uniref:hypothetical protein n=1 Tax=unclassified Bradyrhizobium TaxID=2631580 RepID=UPI003396F810
MPEFDHRNDELRAKRLLEWDAIPGPRVGDFVIMPDGDERRFTHDWGDDIQTTVKRDKNHFNASFYFGGTYMEFSGSLDPALLKSKLVDTGETRLGSAWFFHHGEVGGGNGVHFTMPCRVFKYEG